MNLFPMESGLTIWKPLYVYMYMNIDGYMYILELNNCVNGTGGGSQDSHCWGRGCEGERKKMIFVVINLSLRHQYDNGN